MRENNPLADAERDLGPKDHSEAVALFRAQIIGPLTTRSLLRHGELAEGLRELSCTPVRPPGSRVTRTYSVPTLQRWLYAWRRGGLQALRPDSRRTGFARGLTEAERDLIVDIRREHPTAGVPVILRTLIADGRLEAGRVSAPTVRRLLRAHGLDRVSLRSADPGGVRRRWQASQVGALWHSDVCHGPALKIDGRSVPLRIHALLDDHSRHVVAIQACATEREVEMLALMVKALRSHPTPRVLYLDNGPTYSGKLLSTACGRLGISLVHARPYDPQARGKMERFWRTLREGCLDHIGEPHSLHDVQVRLLAFLDRHYHLAPHASLLGRSPAQVYDTAEIHTDCARRLEESGLLEALTVRARRRVRRDATVDVAGTCFETDAGFLAGRLVTVGRSLLDPAELPWIEHEGQRLSLRPVDPIDNGKRRRRAVRPRGLDLVPFDPAGALLDQLVGRNNQEGER